LYRVARPAAAFFLLTLLVLPFVGCAPPNVPPEIVSLEARARMVAPGDSVLIECVAADENGDELAYEWTSDRGTINGYAGAIAWTAPAEEGLARVSVTVSDGGDVTTSDSIAITVKRNQSPVVSGVTANLEWVPPGESIGLHCEAEDPDGDMLTYTWTADCGELSGEGSNVIWTAPDVETECTVTVVADDGYEGRSKGTVSVVSSLYEPLLVAGITVTAVDEPFYIVPRDDWYKVYWEDSYVIECLVNEPERIVSYEWSDGGPVATFPVGAERIVFEGGPSKIRWTAPKERGEYLLTVTARDATDHVATKTITMMVETCTCAFPKPDVESEPDAES